MAIIYDGWIKNKIIFLNNSLQLQSKLKKILKQKDNK